MLTSLRLGNFKAFAEPQSIPIRPLTLIFGANSSGKSSIIHSLLYAHEASQGGGLNVTRTSKGEDSVDLGGFLQFVHRHEINRQILWSAEFEVTSPEIGGSELTRKCHNAKIELCIGLAPRLSSVNNIARSPLVTGFKLEVDKRIFLQSLTPIRDDGSLTVELNFEHPLFQKSHFSHSSNKKQSSSQKKEVIEYVLNRKPGRLLPIGLLCNIRKTPSKAVKKICIQELRLTTSALKEVSDLIEDLSNSLVNILEQLEYLGPIRSLPPRSLVFGFSHGSNWSAGGSSAYDLLRKNDELRQAVNKWLGKDFLSTHYEFIAEHLWTYRELQECQFFEVMTDRVTDEILNCLHGSKSRAPKKLNSTKLMLELKKRLPQIQGVLEGVFDIGEGFLEPELEMDTSHLRRMMLFDKNTKTLVSLMDVGIGISQVLPVLVKSYAGNDATIAIEQPEIHLHPALQAELADVFIESALGGRNNTFIIETHSEHLLLRVLRRIRETTSGKLDQQKKLHIAPEDVSVLYVWQTLSGARVDRLEVTRDGDFTTPWPEGFFDEREKELFD